MLWLRKWSHLWVGGIGWFGLIPIRWTRWFGRGGVGGGCWKAMGELKHRGCSSRLLLTLPLHLFLLLSTPLRFFGADLLVSSFSRGIFKERTFPSFLLWRKMGSDPCRIQKGSGRRNLFFSAFSNELGSIFTLSPTRHRITSTRGST